MKFASCRLDRPMQTCSMVADFSDISLESFDAPLPDKNILGCEAADCPLFRPKEEMRPEDGSLSILTSAAELVARALKPSGGMAEHYPNGAPDDIAPPVADITVGELGAWESIAGQAGKDGDKGAKTAGTESTEAIKPKGEYL